MLCPRHGHAVMQLQKLKYGWHTAGAYGFRKSPGCGSLVCGVFEPLSTHSVLLGCTMQPWTYAGSADRRSCRCRAWRGVLCCLMCVHLMLVHRKSSGARPSPGLQLL